MARLFHVFRSGKRLWTRCNLRVQSHEYVFARDKARNVFYWRPNGIFVDAVICVECARLRPP